MHRITDLQKSLLQKRGSAQKAWIRSNAERFTSIRTGNGAENTLFKFGGHGGELAQPPPRA